MSEALVIALIAAVSGGSGGLIGKWMEARRETKRERSPAAVKEAEVTLAERSVQVADASMSLLERQVDELIAAQKKSDERQAESDVRAASMAVDLRDMRTEMRGVRHVISVHVGPLINWIDDGAPPPPPEVHADLRDLVLALTAPNQGEFYD